MSARERILAAVRSGLGSVRRDPEAIAADAAALLTSPELIRPRLSSTNLVEAFAERSTASGLGTTLDRVARLSELPTAVRRYLSGHGLPAEVAVQPAVEFAGLDWQDIRTHTTLAPDEAVGVGLARWGIAETGSLVIHSGPDAPILLGFLPLHHIVAVRARCILAHLEDYAAEAKQAGQVARNAILITGASGTTDIEGSYVRGAHGPGFLHVVLVEDEP